MNQGQIMQKTLIVDSSLYKTELCTLAEKYKADKGPYSIGSVNMGHRKGYTAVYTMFMESLRHKHVDMCELGLQTGDSIYLFKEYFKDMDYYGYDNNQDSVNRCTALNIPNTYLVKGNVSNEELDNAFKTWNKQFDIILDDSSHEIEHQLNIIKTGAKYLKSGGILIIEDLERNWPENIYESIQDFITENFSFETFIIAHHNNRVCWDNDKLWIGIKK